MRIVKSFMKQSIDREYLIKRCTEKLNISM